MDHVANIRARPHALTRVFSDLFLLSRQEWRSAFAQAFADFWSDNIPTQSAATTFYVLLALFPAIASFVSLYGMIADVHEAQRHLHYLRGLFPHRGLDLIGQEMIRIAALHSPKLSLAFVLALATSLWSANAGTLALIDGLNTSYEKRETRSYVRRLAISLAFTVGALTLSFLLFAFATLPLFARKLPFALGALHSGVRWIALLALCLGWIVTLYRLGPNDTHFHERRVLPGALVAVVLWLAASALYSLYVGHIADFDRTYGPLGAVIGFLVWIWLSLMVVLFGAELNAVLEKQSR